MKAASKPHSSRPPSITIQEFGASARSTLRQVGETASRDARHRIECSDVALLSWADAIDAEVESLEEQFESLGEAIRLADNFVRQPIDLNYVAIPKDDWEIILAKVSIPASKPEPCEPGQHVWKLTMGGDEYACVKCGTFSEDVQSPASRLDTYER